MEKFKMDRKRLQKLAGIITENSISESIPQNAMKQIPQNVMKMGFKYVGKILEFEPGQDYFHSLDDFYAEVRFGWDVTDDEVEKYLDSLSYEPVYPNGRIVSNYSGKKTVELIKQ
jgi:hypothetical protein